MRDGNPLKHLIPLGVAILLLLGAMLHDFLLDKETTGDEPIFTSGGLVDSTPYIDVRFHGGKKGDRFDDKEPNPTMRFGVVTLKDSKQDKKLTFDEWGRSNNTCVTVDSFTTLFGSSSGNWVDLSAPLGKDAEGNERVGRRSVWALRNANVHITQEVERIRGDVSGKLDTCLVRYTLENKDARPHRVGIRFLLDTFIGANDGVPFTIPGSSGLCDTREQFQGNTVPAYIEALENESLTNPGTIARIQFRLGEKIDPPDRVLLGGWPDSNLQVLGYESANAQQTLWEVPFTNIKELHEQGKKVGKNLAPDSAVTLYWGPAPLEPGQTRTVGFTYGLGDVSSDQGGGKLALTLGGRLVKGGELTLTALVHQPAPDESLSLDLPAQLELSDGSTQVSVPAVPPGSPRPISTVSWRLLARDSGPCEITVKSNKGAQQTLKLTLKARGPFD
jgi:hypothetical protein